MDGEKEVGSTHKVRYALTRLMEGKDGIGYFYQDCSKMKK
jgi:hypothetical protein